MRQLSLIGSRRLFGYACSSCRAVMLSMVILACPEAFSQEVGVKKDISIQVPSTQTFDFMRYGNTPVNYNTGTATLSIPIYTYKDEDFVIPISATYASEGYKPGRQSGYLGHNWSLTYGGAVTREVRGLPDEQYPTNSSYPVYGSLRRSSASNYQESALLALPDEYNVSAGYSLAENGNRYELEPDIFRFNFMGYKGAFVVDGQKRVRVFDTQSAGEFKIELFGMNQNTNSIQSVGSSIVITTGDGYKYTFGGSNAATEYSVETVASDDNPVGTFTGNGTVSAWYLVKIEAPNSRVVTFNYKENSSNTIGQWGDIPMGNYVVTPVRYNGTEANLSPSSADALIKKLVANPPGMRFDVNKVVYPTSINIADVFTLTFGYEDKAREFDHASSHVTPILSKLKSIEGRNSNNTVVEKAIMTYIERTISFDNTSDQTGNGITGISKTFLDNISLLTSGVYKFEYSTNQQNNLPCIKTTNIDHWGYWNSNMSSEVKGLIPNNDTRRDPSATLFDVGLLTKVTYPTGGYTAFEYEPHYYNAYMGYSGTAGSYFSKVSVSATLAGGARIKSVTDYDGLKNRKRVFDYQDSGVMSDMPKYKTIVGYVSSNNLTPLNFVIISSVGRSFYTMDPYISYTTVREKFPDNSYDEYCYTDLGTNVDNVYGQVDRMRFFAGSVDNAVTVKEMYRVSNSRAFDRGQLLYKKSYLPNGTLLRSETTNYAHVNAGDYVAGATLYGNSGRLYVNSYKIYTDIFLPASVTVTENMGGTNFVKTVSTGYNTYAQPTTVTTKDSRGTQQQTTNSYVTTMTSPTDPALAAMKTKNILRYPLETASQIGSDNKTIAATATTFVQAGGGVLPYQVKRLRLDAPLSGYTGYYGGVSQNNFDNVFSYDIYDSQGRIRQVTTKDGIKVCYLWSYNNRYIVAKIEGATFSEVTAVLSVTPDALAAISTISTSDLSTLNNMRNSLGTGALVTIYEHKPDVGVSSITEPSGRVLKYEYDGRNRLKFIKDENNKILEAYDIKLSTEP